MAGVAGEPLFVAVVLCATSLGVVIPVLKDAGQSGSTFGQLVIAAASIADFATVILLSLLFSREATRTTTRALLLGGLFAVAVLEGSRSRGSNISRGCARRRCGFRTPPLRSACAVRSCCSSV